MKLYFFKIIISILAGMLLISPSIFPFRAEDSAKTVDKDGGWIESHPEKFQWPQPVGSNYSAGDCNDDKKVTILDITFAIAYLYKNGQPPRFCAACDVNADMSFSIFDINHMINYFYKDGPPLYVGTVK